MKQKLAFWRGCSQSKPDLVLVVFLLRIKIDRTKRSGLETINEDHKGMTFEKQKEYRGLQHAFPMIFIPKNVSRFQSPEQPGFEKEGGPHIYKVWRNIHKKLSRSSKSEKSLWGSWVFFQKLFIVGICCFGCYCCWFFFVCLFVFFVLKLPLFSGCRGQTQPGVNSSQRKAECDARQIN